MEGSIGDDEPLKISDRCRRYRNRDLPTSLVGLRAGLRRINIPRPPWRQGGLPSDTIVSVPVQGGFGLDDRKGGMSFMSNWSSVSAVRRGNATIAMNRSPVQGPPLSYDGGMPSRSCVTHGGIATCSIHGGGRLYSVLAIGAHFA